MKIFHNPRCTKSRQTLTLLEQHDVQVEVVEYLKSPPTAAELKRVVKKLGLAATEIVRPKEAKDAGLDLSAMSDAEIIDAIVQHPKVLQRPIVVHGNEAVIGRPPENVLTLLGKRSPTSFT